MNILLVLIPVTGLIVAVAVAVFFWAVNHQQFDDLESPGILPLLDDPDQGADAPGMESSPPSAATDDDTRTTDAPEPAPRRTDHRPPGR